MYIRSNNSKVFYHIMDMGGELVTAGSCFTAAVFEIKSADVETMGDLLAEQGFQVNKDYSISFP